MNSHTCQDCDHKFFDIGQSQDSISPAVQCPNCHSYRTQPSGIPDEANDMVHGIGAMPGQDQQDDMSGNPLKEGILADGGWKNRQVRDETFASVRSKISLFETPEFETTQLVAPPDLYRDALKSEATHKTSIQIPKGVTDNLHASLGNLQAWVENPYENGQLRPYNDYWKVIRPSFMKPGSLQIGVAEPTMAEIINHVAQTDDLTPLYQYRGRTSHTKKAGPALALLPEGAAALAGGEAAAGAGAAAAGSAAEAGGAAALGAGEAGGAIGAGAGADAAGAMGTEMVPSGGMGMTAPEVLDGEYAGETGAGGAEGASGNGPGWFGGDDVGGGSAEGTIAEEPGQIGAGDAASAKGVGGTMRGIMKGVGGGIPRGIGMQVGMQGLNYVDDIFGMGASGQGHGQGGGGGGVQDPSYYARYFARMASDEDDAHPDSHDEIPKQEDGDHKQQDDGNNHEWQRDISVNGVGGTEHSPSFDPKGPGMERFMMMLPLLMQYLESGEDGSQDPLVQGLHQTLDSEIPGYLDHGDEGEGHKLVMMIAPHLKGKGEPEKNEPDHTDENSGGKHESKVHSQEELEGFLPIVDLTSPGIPGLTAAMPPYGRGVMPAQGPNEALADSANWPSDTKDEFCPHCGSYNKMQLGICPQCRQEVYPSGQAQEQGMEYVGKMSQGPPGMGGGMPGPPGGGMPPGMPPPGMGAPPPGPPPSGPPTGQGPNNDEQKAAVAKLLLSTDRADEIPNMIANPHDYAKELAQIQKSQPPPEDDSQTAEPPMPAQEQAPPGDTMPVPGMDAGSAQSMMSAVERYAADSVASKCPSCGGHTTALLNPDDGTSKCHSCSHIFKTKGLLSDGVNTGDAQGGHVGRVADADSPHQESPYDDGAVQGVPIADQHRQRDLREEQDSGHTWLDEDGNPLKVGQQYEMYSSRYDIPDLVMLEAVKPSSIVFTLTGEYGLNHSTELTRQEANIERISFRASQEQGELGDPDGLEQNNDDNTGYQGEPERRDMSAPSGLVSSTQENPNLAWLKSDGMTHSAGANFTPYEQRSFIDEPGEARNASSLDLLGTHYLQDEGEGDEQFLFGY